VNRAAEEQGRKVMNVRIAIPEDVPLIFSFIQKKIAFDRAIGAYSGIPSVTEAKLQKTLFGAIPFAHVWFATTPTQDVGFALCHFRYSSFAAQPSLWLDDLFVDEDARSQGAGTALMGHLAQIAQVHDCTHLAWNADAHNTRGLSFYHRLGAKITEQKDHRCFLKWIP
jgi:GNAT superfamily N-acetyltransferase